VIIETFFSHLDEIAHSSICKFIITEYVFLPAFINPVNTLGGQGGRREKRREKRGERKERGRGKRERRKELI
jgi:hypothetical protein